MPPNNSNSSFPQVPNHQGVPSVGLGSPKKSFNILIVPLIVSVILLIGVLAFGIWAFMERDTFKNKTDKIVAEEVTKAKEQVASEKDAEFVEKEKEPNKEYKGPDAFGGVSVLYPKTWSAFVTEDDKGTTPIDGYFHPNFVPAIKPASSFALRVKVVNSSYANELKRFDSDVKTGKVKVTAIVVQKVSGITGSRLDGEIANNKQGSLVMFPLRDKTLLVSTEASQFMGDFNNIILTNLSFSP